MSDPERDVDCSVGCIGTCSRGRGVRFAWADKPRVGGEFPDFLFLKRPGVGFLVEEIDEDGEGDGTVGSCPTSVCEVWASVENEGKEGFPHCRYLREWFMAKMEVSRARLARKLEE